MLTAQMPHNIIHIVIFVSILFCIPEIHTDIFFFSLIIIDFPTHTPVFYKGNMYVE